MKIPLPENHRARVKAWMGQQWREWRWYAFFLCFVWMPLRSAVIDYSPVPTGSMNPTILEGDVVWVNKLAYGLRVPLTQLYLSRWSEPQRGDIVVVLSPLDGTRLVKRVIGVPGDTVELRDNRLVLNGRAVDYEPAAENYGERIARRLQPHAFFAEENLAGLAHPVMGLRGAGATARNYATVTVPPGGYFLMGDARDNSRDSREFGFATREAILGKAEGVLVSLDINDSYLPRPGRFFSELR
ncbi:signal peptidase I [Oleiharenicola lentus]|nr:signal peptidase I [Oleiharenicola lentus]